LIDCFCLKKQGDKIIFVIIIFFYKNRQKDDETRDCFGVVGGLSKSALLSSFTFNLNLLTFLISKY